MSLPHTVTANTIRRHRFRAVLSEDGEFCSDTLAIEETDEVSLCIRLTAHAPNGGRFYLMVDYGGDGDGLEGVEGNLAYALRF